MRLTHHLVRHRSGTYHFRLKVPTDLRAQVGKRVVKRSLRTTNARVALAAALALHARYAAVFALIRGGGVARDKFDLDVYVKDGPARKSDYRIDAERGIVETDGSEAEHARAMETLRLLGSIGRVPPDLPVAPQSAVASEASEAPRRTLREGVSYWETVDKPAMRNAATAAERHKTIEDFAAHVGDKRPLPELRRLDVASWVAHRRGARKNEQSTTKKLANHIKAFFDAMRRAGFYPDDLSNPAHDVVKFTKKDQDERARTHGWQAFTAEQLRTIFSPANLGRTREIHTRRAMLIALYTGARVGEIAQLRLSGFRDADGQPVMRIEGELKTDASYRDIPIHPDLVRLGLLDWVLDQRRRGCTRLFPTVKLDGKSGKGNALSKGFSNLIELIGVAPTIDPDLALTKTLAPRIGMHSFRDTLIQAMQGRTSEELRKAYVGHSFEGARPRKEQARSAHEVSYMRAWSVEEIAQVFRGISWGGWLDFEGLAPLLAQTDEEHARAMKAMERRERVRVQGQRAP
jgi:integrase